MPIVPASNINVTNGPKKLGLWEKGVVKQHFWSSITTAKDVEGDTPAAVKSAARAFRIVEFFAEVRRGARANEIADRLGIPQSSTSVLLSSMVRLGYLDFDFTSHTYRPTLRVAMLGAWLDKGPFRDGAILDMVEKLAGDTGYAVSLSARNDIYVRYLHAIQARDPRIVRITLAIRRYAAWSSAGTVLLVGIPQTDLRALVRRTRAEKDSFVQRFDVAQVLNNVEAAASQGYFFSRGLVTPKAGSISIRLPQSLTGEGQPIALSVAGDLAVIADHEHDIVERMRRDIDELSKKYTG